MGWDGYALSAARAAVDSIAAMQKMIRPMMNLSMASPWNMAHGERARKPYRSQETALGLSRILNGRKRPALPMGRRGRPGMARKDKPGAQTSRWHKLSAPRQDFTAGLQNHSIGDHTVADMKTSLTDEQLADPAIAEADRILNTCQHFGFCTAGCPTYVLLHDENDTRPHRSDQRKCWKASAHRRRGPLRT